MIIKCEICGKEFDKPSHRNQHKRDAHDLAWQALKQIQQNLKSERAATQQANTEQSE